MYIFIRLFFLVLPILLTTSVEARDNMIVEENIIHQLSNDSISLSSIDIARDFNDIDRNNVSYYQGLWRSGLYSAIPFNIHDTKFIFQGIVVNNSLGYFSNSQFIGIGFNSMRYVGNGASIGTSAHYISSYEDDIKKNILSINLHTVFNTGSESKFNILNHVVGIDYHLNFNNSFDIANKSDIFYSIGANFPLLSSYKELLFKPNITFAYNFSKLQGVMREHNRKLSGLLDIRLEYKKVFDTYSIAFKVSIINHIL